MKACQSHQGVKNPMHNVKRQTRKGTITALECCANTCKPLRKVLRMLVKFECEHMKACQSRQRANLVNNGRGARKVDRFLTQWDYEILMLGFVGP